VSIDGSRVRDRSLRELIAGFAVRALTGGAIALIMLAAVFQDHPLVLGVLLALISAKATTEFFKISVGRDRRLHHRISVVAAALMPISTALYGFQGLGSLVASLLLLLLGLYCFVKELKIADVTIAIVGALYVGFMLSHLVLLHRIESGELFVLAVIISVWVNDVSAYLVGSAFGRHKMAPKISPNKSWEGFCAGTAFSVMVWSAMVFLPGNTTSLPLLVLIGVTLAIVGVIGDLLESRIKREFGVKDSGTLFPGHGGALDRFDSLIVASMVAHYLFIALGV